MERKRKADLEERELVKKGRVVNWMMSLSFRQWGLVWLLVVPPYCLLADWIVNVLRSRPTTLMQRDPLIMLLLMIFLWAWMMLTIYFDEDLCGKSGSLESEVEKGRVP